MSGNVEVIARGVVCLGGRVLLCRSRGDENTYLPGGHVEFNECAREALRREIDEEMGRPADVGVFLGCVEHTFIQGGERHCEVNLVFAMEVPGLSPDTVPVACEGDIEFLWSDVDGLASLRLEPAPLCGKLVSWLAAEGESERWATTYG